MDELEALKIRDEVLQAMYWMHAEGLSEAPSSVELSRFVGVPPEMLEVFLTRLVIDGDLEPAFGGYALTERGQEHGKRSFADEFADLTRPTHGECDEDCWCHDSPEEAAKCLEDRVGHVHS